MGRKVSRIQCTAERRNKRKSKNGKTEEQWISYVIIIIIITTTIFIVLSSMAPAICHSSLWFLWAKVGQRQEAANS